MKLVLNFSVVAKMWRQVATHQQQCHRPSWILPVGEYGPTLQQSAAVTTHKLQKLSTPTAYDRPVTRNVAWNAIVPSRECKWICPYCFYAKIIKTVRKSYSYVFIIYFFSMVWTIGLIQINDWFRPIDFCFEGEENISNRKHQNCDGLFF